MSDIYDAKLRCCALEKEAFAAEGVTLDAVPYVLYTQESFPYFTHLTGRRTYDWDSQQERPVGWEIIARLVIGHLTERYVGQTEEQLDEYIEIFQRAFIGDRVRHLVSAEYPVKPIYLETLGIELVSCAGFQVFAHTGIGSRQVGTAFVIGVPMRYVVCE